MVNLLSDMGTNCPAGLQCQQNGDLRYPAAQPTAAGQALEIQLHEESSQETTDGSFMMQIASSVVGAESLCCLFPQH